MLITLEKPVNKCYLKPKSPFHNALEEAELRKEDRRRRNPVETNYDDRRERSV